ncbi:hypothetical protein [Escherichia coli]
MFLCSLLLCSLLLCIVSAGWCD